MALGFLNFLELGARVARPFIQLGVTLGRSLAEIGAALTRAGAGIEASAARRIYEAEQVERGVAADIVSGGVTRTPERGEYSESITKQRREFAWRVRIGYVDPRTGEQQVQFITISTNALLSPQEAMDQAQSLLSEDYGVESNFIVSNEVVSATRAPLGQRL